jgi:hypothetical protein
MNPHVRENLQSPMTIVDRTIGRPARLSQNKIILVGLACQVCVRSYDSHIQPDTFLNYRCNCYLSRHSYFQLRSQNRCELDFTTNATHTRKKESISRSTTSRSPIVTFLTAGSRCCPKGLLQLIRLNVSSADSSTCSNRNFWF